METVSLADSSLIFRFRPSPCPNHYDRRLATMPSADFCSITMKIAPHRAIGFHQIRSPGLMNAKSQGTSIPGPYWLTTDCPKNRSPRIRALTFPALLHHLRWPLDHMVSLSCASSPSAYASYDVLVHQLAVLLAASSRPLLTGQPLPFASSYGLLTAWFSAVIFLQGTFTPLVNAHAGRTQGQPVGRSYLAPLLAALFIRRRTRFG